jgi:hypothetical protein
MEVDVKDGSPVRLTGRDRIALAERGADERGGG